MKWSKLLKILAVMLFSGAALAAPPDYTEMVGRIDKLLHGALASYRANDAVAAKEQAQDAYFQVFENLEGPIRINVSAKRSYELEAMFGEIRTMFKQQQPEEVVAARIDDLLSGIRLAIKEVEATGHVLTAETSHPGPVVSTSGVASVWMKAMGVIETDLRQAVDNYRNNKPAKARKQIQAAQFDGYQNSLLEIAIRQERSQARAAAHTSAFAELLAGIHEEITPDRMIEMTTELETNIRQDLPGLPVPEALAGQVPTSSSAVALVPEAKDWQAVSQQILAAIEDARYSSSQGEADAASRAVQDAYFDLFEASGMESAVGARDINLKVRLEGHFTDLVAQLKASASEQAQTASVTALKADLLRAEEMLNVTRQTSWAFFLNSLVIILREGMEIILIISALVAYLVKTGNRDRVKVIINGSVWALGVSLVGAVLLKVVLTSVGAAQEVLEGATMLLAAVVLFFVSYWLISKAEAAKWQSYIRGQVDRSLRSGSLWGLWLAAFLTVVREGAETMLFYAALLSSAPTHGRLAIAAGFLVGLVMLAAIYLIMRRGIVRLPLRPFFIVTGGLLYLMAFIFAGNGLKELIEGGVFHAQTIAWLPRLPLLGVHPYLITVLAQGVILCAGVAGIVITLCHRPLVENKKEPNQT